MSAKIYYLRRPCRRHPVPAPASLRGAARPSSRPAGGFVLLLFLTMPAAFLYLTGAVKVARHDGLYAALLTAVWGVYFVHERLLRIRVLGPLLIGACRLLLFAAVAGFFGGIYWLILTRS